MNNLYQELSNLRAEFGIRQADYLSEEENLRYREMAGNGIALPENIMKSKTVEGAFYRVEVTELNAAEIVEWAQLKQTKFLKSIKGWVTFFGVLMVISLVGAVITILASGILAANLR